MKSSAQRASQTFEPVRASPAKPVGFSVVVVVESGSVTVLDVELDESRLTVDDVDDADDADDEPTVLLVDDVDKTLVLEVVLVDELEVVDEVDDVESPPTVVVDVVVVVGAGALAVHAILAGASLGSTATTICVFQYLSS